MRRVQKPHPPVWIPGGGASVDTWRWCVENDYLYAYLSYFGYESGRHSMQSYWDVVEEMGADMNPHRAGFLQFVGVADSDAHAEELYKEPALYFYNRCLHWYPGFTNVPGYMSIESMRRGLRSQVQTAGAISKTTSSETTWKEIVDKAYVVCGSPQTVVDRLMDLGDALRVGHLMLLLHFGNMSKELAYENTSRFATEVMPKLRDKFSQWDDPWYPVDPPAGAEPAPLGDARGMAV